MSKPNANKPQPAAKPVAVAKPAKVVPVAVAKPVSSRTSGPSYKALEAVKAKSVVANPVQAMWDLCNATIGQPRKAVVMQAIEQGISYHTARTQYQAWFKLACSAAAQQATA